MTRSLAGLGASWRETLLEEIWAGTPKTWDRRYDPDARYMIDQALSRLLAAMTSRGNTSLAECKLDGLIEVSPIAVPVVEGRGDFRYKPDNMAAILRKDPTKDLVPIVCSRTRNGFRVLDGHHRLRASESAGRCSILAVVVSVTPGSGMISLGSGLDGSPSSDR